MRRARRGIGGRSDVCDDGAWHGRAVPRIIGPPIAKGAEMFGFVVSTLVVALALAVTATVLPQIDYGDSVQTLLVVALIFGLVNALVKPVARLLSLPLRMMTLGTFTFVINAALLLLVAWLAGQLGFTFTIGDFPPDLTAEVIGVALVASLVISAVTTAIGLIVPG